VDEYENPHILLIWFGFPTWLMMILHLIGMLLALASIANLKTPFDSITVITASSL